MSKDTLCNFESEEPVMTSRSVFSGGRETAKHTIMWQSPFGGTKGFKGFYSLG